MAEIASIFRVLVDFKAIIVSLHKEFSLDANYRKGHGTIFREWFRENHAGEFLFHTERLKGTRQDIVAMGSLAIVWSRVAYLEFLDERLRGVGKSDRILQTCLFIELSSLQIAAAARLFSILYLSIVVPVRFLAGKTHTLSDCTVNGHNAKFQEMLDKPELIVDEQFMMGMFSFLEEKIPKFKKYNEYLYEPKKSVFISRDGSKVVSFKLSWAELFNPTDEDNQATTPIMEKVGK